MTGNVFVNEYRSVSSSSMTLMKVEIIIIVYVTIILVSSICPSTTTIYDTENPGRENKYKEDYEGPQLRSSSRPKTGFFPLEGFLNIWELLRSCY